MLLLDHESSAAVQNTPYQDFNLVLRFSSLMEADADGTKARLDAISGNTPGANTQTGLHILERNYLQFQNLQVLFNLAYYERLR